jgi:hypothetical protein
MVVPVNETKLRSALAYANIFHVIGHRVLDGVIEKDWTEPMLADCIDQLKAALEELTIDE